MSAICWWMLGRLDIRVAIRLATTLFFAFGTVFWYSAQLATTWYQAHIVAIGLTMLAIGLALRADPRAQVDEAAEPIDDLPVGGDPGVGRRRRPWSVERRQFVSGLLFGLACTARLTVVLAAPFFLLVGAGGSLWRRGWSAALGAVIPIGLLVAYNVVSTGHVMNPAYDYLYRIEAAGYPSLGYHPDWAIEDARYLPQNLGDHAVHAAGHPADPPARRPGRGEHAGLHGAGRPARPVRRSLPAGGALGHRHERAPRRAPRSCSGSPRCATTGGSGS